MVVHTQVHIPWVLDNGVTFSVLILGVLIRGVNLWHISLSLQGVCRWWCSYRCGGLLTSQQWGCLQRPLWQHRDTHSGTCVHIHVHFVHLNVHVHVNFIILRHSACVALCVCDLAQPAKLPQLMSRIVSWFECLSVFVWVVLCCVGPWVSDIWVLISHTRTFLRLAYGTCKFRSSQSY